MYDKDPKLGGKLFTGLLYEQYEDSAFVGKLYKWYSNGKLKEFVEKDEHDKYIRTIHWDENVNITYLVENGNCIINRDY